MICEKFISQQKNAMHKNSCFVFVLHCWLYSNIITVGDVQMYLSPGSPSRLFPQYKHASIGVKCGNKQWYSFCYDHVYSNKTQSGCFVSLRPLSVTSQNSKSPTGCEDTTVATLLTKPWILRVTDSQNKRKGMRNKGTAI